MHNLTITATNANYLVEGVQLRERKFIPLWLGKFIMWLFFHRKDTATEITLSGFDENILRKQ